MKVILANKTAELVEKKSRFIANIFYVQDVKDAETKLDEVKKKYYDAKHNCFAYIIGKDAAYVKTSDDGEPSGTAGHPMLDILRGYDVTNILAVVTRYFGGVLLGTGGLVRAYSDSLKMAISDATLAEIKKGYVVSFSLDYDMYGKYERYKMPYGDDIYELKKDFVDNVRLSYIINEKIYDKVSKDISDMTKGKIIFDKNEYKTYYMDNKKVIFIL